MSLSLWFSTLRLQSALALVRCGGKDNEHWIGGITFVSRTSRTEFFGFICDGGVGEY
jgi:hypothetical protein